MKGEHRAAGGDRAGKQQRTVEPLPYLLNEREGRQRPGMAARARRDRDQPVRTLADRRTGMPVVDHVVQHDAAIGMHGLVDLGHRAQRRDHDRHLVFDAHAQVVLKPFVGGVHDLVHRERRGRPVRIGSIVGGQCLGDLGEPRVELALGPGVQRRKRADDAGLALGKHHRRMRQDEHGGRDHGHAQVGRKNIGQRHGNAQILTFS